MQPHEHLIPTSTRHTTVRGDRLELLRWAASLGAVTAEALALRQGVSPTAARGRLSAACRRGLLERTRPLNGLPALYALTASGLRAAGLPGARRCKVSPGNAIHLISCAGAAAALERCYPGYRVLGECELRSLERACGRALASARPARSYPGDPDLHRPDLVLLAPQSERSLPVAVEVELTVKAPRRLREICRAWARCSAVAGVLYLVADKVEAPLSRAVAATSADERIAVVRLSSLPSEPA
jgi:hypothetical protein